MTPPTLYEQALAAGVQPPKAKILPSTAIVLHRGQGEELEIFWVQRSETMKFMGGWHAFPGGGVSRKDSGAEEQLRASGWLKGQPTGLSEDQRSGAMPAALLAGVEPFVGDEIPGLIAGSLRELLEETGLAPRVGDEDAKRLRSLRSRLANEEPWSEAVAAEGLTLDASRLVFAGRWITPPLGPFRFDNRFFLLEWSEDLEPQLSGEAAGGEWIKPAEAVARWHAGSIIAAPPILYMLEALAAAASATSATSAMPRTALPRLLEPIDANLGAFRRIEFVPGVLLFPLPTPTLPPASHTNAYVVGTGDAVLIDPGSPFPEVGVQLIEALRGLPTLGRTLREIWLTHHHPDHIGAVERVRQAFDLPVAAHAATAERVASAGIRVDRILEEGEILELPGPKPMAFEVFHTPGHARGHLCFFDRAGGSLIAGDLISTVSTIVVDPPEGNMDDYFSSLERMRDLGPRTLMPGHGPVITQAVAKLEAFLRHRRWREAKVVAAWQAGARSAEEMLPTVYDDAPEAAYPLALRQIIAHLESLQGRGELPS